MEQQLIDVLNNAENPDDINDVSKAMITARVMNALVKVRKLTATYLENLEAIQKENSIELKLSRLTVVLNVTDDISSENINQTCILGSRDSVLKNVAQLMEKLNG